MSWRVLITAPYMLPIVERFTGFFAQHEITPIKADVRERMEEADLLPIIGDIDGVVSGDDRFTAKVFAAAPRLRVISKWGTGIDSIDAEAAARHGVRVCRTLDAFTQPVGDTQLGYILAFARRQPWMDRMMKAGVWDKIPGRALNESTIGVIGVGATGKATLRRAKPFGARLLGHDIRPVDPAFVAEVGLDLVSLETLLQASDYVSVCCDLNPTSHHILSTKQFGLMKDTAVVINAARGPLIDEKALVAALQASKIGGAALDVFEHEPLPADSPLRRMDNVMLAPHNANSSPKAWERVHENTLRQLVDGLLVPRG